MTSFTSSAARRRRRVDSMFERGIKISAMGPVILMVLMILTLFNWSSGTVAVADGRLLGQWSLVESVMNAAEIREEIARIDGEVSTSFRFPLTPGIILDQSSSSPRENGLRAPLLGSVRIIGLGLVLAFPLSLTTALWLDSAREHSQFAKFLQVFLGLFARMPHIIFGIGAMAVFARINDIAGGSASSTLGHAGLLMGLIMIPKLTLMMERELSGTPDTVKYASYALGASWQSVVFRQVLPSSLELILIGTLRLIGTLLGLASPFIALGAASDASTVPSSLRGHFIALPVRIFQWALHPDEVHRSLAASAALFMVMVILIVDYLSHIWRRRVLRRREGLR